LSTETDIEIEENVSSLPQNETKPEFNSQAGTAAVLSFFVTGAGQVYNGQILKGIFATFLMIISVALIFKGVGILTTPIIWIVGIYDAYDTAAGDDS
jgi:TM2 domain-containing membrane protein YozV